MINIMLPLLIVIEIIGSIILVSPPKKQQSKIGSVRQNVLGVEDEETASSGQSQTSIAESSSSSSISSDQIQTSSPASSSTSPISSASLSDQSQASTASSISSDQLQENNSSAQTNTDLSSNASTQDNQESSSSTQESNPSSQEVSPSSVSSVQTELQSDTDNEKTTLTDLNNNIKNQEDNLYNNMNNKNASDAVSDENKNEMNEDNSKLEQAETPLEKANLLIQFGDKDIQHINDTSKDNNLNEVVFHTEKFNNQLDQAIDAIQKLPPEQAEKVKQDVAILCNNADSTFRQQELLVGEVDAQTIETARGKCLNYTYEQ